MRPVVAVGYRRRQSADPLRVVKFWSYGERVFGSELRALIERVFHVRCPPTRLRSVQRAQAQAPALATDAYRPVGDTRVIGPLQSGTEPESLVLQDYPERITHPYGKGMHWERFRRSPGAGSGAHARHTAE